MAIEVVSGSVTPLSGKTTVVATPTAELKTIPLHLGGSSFKKSASEIIELVASRSSASSAVYVYDVAEQVGFGTLTKSWSTSVESSAPVISLQTRAGAGLSLVGRLSEGTSQDAAKGAVLTAYTTPTGLAAMAQSLLYLPPASASSRLVIQVPAVTSIGETFALSPTLAPLSTTIGLLPNNIVVLLSATPQESIDLAMLSYKLISSHVIHIFDHHSSSREVGHPFVPALPLKEAPGLTVPEAIRWSGYSLFDYAGDQSAHTVLVFLNGPLALIAKALAGRVRGLGVVVVRVLRPWDGDALREVIPSSVKEVYVFDDVPNEATQGSLFVDVFGSLYDPTSPGPVVRGQRTTPGTTQKYLSTPSLFTDALLHLAHIPSAALAAQPSSQRKLLFFSKPKSTLSALPQIVSDTFAKTIPTRLLTAHDVFSKAGGVTADRVVLSSREESASPVSVSGVFPLGGDSAGEADFIGVLEPSLLKSHSVLSYAKRGSAILVVTPWESTELLANLSSDVLSLARERKLRIYTIDARAAAATLAGETGPAHEAVQNLIVHLAFLRLYLGRAATESVVGKLAHGAAEDVFHGIELAKINAAAWADLVEVELPAEAPLTAAEGEAKAPAPLKQFEFNAIAVETDDGSTIVNGAKLSSWHDAAKHLLIPSIFIPPPAATTESYPQIPALRPEVPERTFLVTCTVNRRLTPHEYDRNVFHLEFDTAGTGLKYAIGEALGVHGWNDEREVLDFLAWYGVDPGRLITIPVVAGEGEMHTRTVLQALQQQIDLFGQPPKSFYTDLAAYATNPTDKFALLFIGSPEGASTFKKLSEKDTVTFAEVMQRYPSARPGIETLCEMIGDIKPRHYSIASAQSVVGDRVDLLVVTVDWVTPSGSPRYGQCTRYLAGLKVGQKVTVSIKPSVMKLPPDNLQPIIMAGLGTGAAPFRAFLQHRALLAAQNIPVGPTYYYFGSRHRSQEYLYGEEIEAYILDGTITKAGLAFSRDGARKVYIQHLMLEDAGTLADMLKNREGVFYLCGPTWPVPDVYEALVGALVKEQGYDREGAGAFLEGLKEEERYVLEVY
ncbi:assimilatory sulfite reductase [Leucogyrophana mollusca]|uniref:Assimilatory sulfite reductase n=1 Tax=Leucogyrophana mollusca TaxID=85980 RepID=A0ACB8BXC2_9AGAM|nr:assimilatory sulfite reductase [Leucogyrophana mollusca]